MSNIYNTIYEYADGADISHYRISNNSVDAPDTITSDFSPADDPDFMSNVDDVIHIDGRRYISAGWGETGPSYIAGSVILDVCYARYTLVFASDTDRYGEYVSDGIVYETRADAEKV